MDLKNELSKNVKSEETIHSYLSVSNFSHFQFTTDFTVSFWLFPSCIQTSTLIDAYLWSIQLVQNERKNAMFVQLCLNTHSQLPNFNRCFESQDFITSGNWHHVTISFHYSALYDESFPPTVKILIDGKELNTYFPDFYVTSEDWNGFVKNTKRSLIIGSDWKFISPFDGSFDDISFWNTSFTTTPLKQFVYQVFSGRESRLVCYFSFNNYEVTSSQIFDQSTNKLEAKSTGQVSFRESFYKPFVTANRCVS
jgi:hypothetical protein